MIFTYALNRENFGEIWIGARGPAKKRRSLVPEKRQNHLECVPQALGVLAQELSARHRVAGSDEGLGHGGDATVSDTGRKGARLTKDARHSLGTLQCPTVSPI